MHGRARDHIRANVVGYLALFVALGGSAYAANTIGSADIIDGEVKSADIGNGEVKSADIGDGEVKSADLVENVVGSNKIADRQVKNADLSIGASSSNTIADGGIEGVDVKANTLGGPQIDEATLEKVPEADAVDGTHVKHLNAVQEAGTLQSSILSLPGIGFLRAACDESSQATLDFLNQSGFVTVFVDDGAASPQGRSASPGSSMSGEDVAAEPVDMQTWHIVDIDSAVSRGAVIYLQVIESSFSQKCFIRMSAIWTP